MPSMSKQRNKLSPGASVSLRRSGPSKPCVERTWVSAKPLTFSSSLEGEEKAGNVTPRMVSKVMVVHIRKNPFPATKLWIGDQERQSKQNSAQQMLCSVTLVFGIRKRSTGELSLPLQFACLLVCWCLIH